uniref:Uncharacterized protein n=1 Tax=Anguilla anguilla TaxID=7936 RepID=A0A0E9Q729_ANGAN
MTSLISGARSCSFQVSTQLAQYQPSKVLSFYFTVVCASREQQSCNI